MRPSSDSTVAALARGAIAGLAGTAAMTAAQTVYYKKTEAEPSSTPAEVAKRVIGGVLQRDVDDDRTDELNTAMHWVYGTGWGVLYGLAARRPNSGLAFGTVVWAAGQVHLPLMQLAPPIWKSSPAAIAPDLGFHLVYGVGSGVALRALLRARPV